jgi:hypothetical protein
MRERGNVGTEWKKGGKGGRGGQGEVDRKLVIIYMNTIGHSTQ